MVRHALSLAQYDVQEAENGLHALRILDADLPDLIILDLGLPLISGHMVRVEIAAHAHTRDIPVIVITGSVGDHAQLQVAHVLQKPFDVDRLMETVSGCIRSGLSA